MLVSSDRPFDYVLVWDDALISQHFDSNWEKNIIYSREFLRLRRISFLGAIDYVLHPNQWPSSRRHCRFDHSLSVYLLAKQFLSSRGVSELRAREYGAAALLHDIGHLPLSHSIEPVVEKIFGQDHHSLSEHLILDSRSSINKVLLDEGIDPHLVVDLIRDGDKVDGFPLLNGPINFDTIDAIFRSFKYINSQSVSVPHPLQMLDCILRMDTKTEITLDHFWKSKEMVYHYLINGAVGTVLDCASQAYLMKNCKKVPYLLISEPKLRKLIPELFDFFRMFRGFFRDSGSECLLKTLVGDCFRRNRAFHIVRGVHVSRLDDIPKRYISGGQDDFFVEIGPVSACLAERQARQFPVNDLLLEHSIQ